MSATDDIKESWLNPIRAAQAACKNNRGLAVVTMRVLVHKNDALRWSEPKLEKVHPARIDKHNTNDEILEIVLNMDSVDNT